MAYLLDLITTAPCPWLAFAQMLVIASLVVAIPATFIAAGCMAIASRMPARRTIHRAKHVSRFRR